MQMRSTEVHSLEEKARREQEALEARRQEMKRASAVQEQKPKPVRRERPVPDSIPGDPEQMSISDWLFTICWIRIPFFGFLYACVVALRRGNNRTKKNYAAAYIIYRLLVLVLTVAVLYVFYKVGLDFVDQMLSYVK